MCGIQYAVLFIYFTGVAFLLLIYVLLCMICWWDPWHGLCRVFGWGPRLKGSHGFRITWHPSMGISVFTYLFIYTFFWIYSSKWERVRSDSPVKRVSRKFGCKWEILQVDASECICFAWSCCCRFCLHKEAGWEIYFELVKILLRTKNVASLYRAALVFASLFVFLFIHNSSFKRQLGQLLNQPSL